MKQKKYKKALADYLNVEPKQISLFWRGRVALFTILKALKIREGDEVILPSFTCVVVPSAIKYLGATPIYCDINPETYNIEVEKIEKKITSKTKAILAQNTFGLSADLDPILELAKRHNLKVIEDCAHGFGGTYRGRKNGTSADAAFFSSQWNKPFSTGIGGILICNDLELLEKINALEYEIQKPSFKDEKMLALQIFIKKNLLHPFIYWSALKIYRWASSTGLISGSSDAGELTRIKMPKGYLKSGANIQAKEGLKSLKIFNKNLEHRINISNRYASFFEEIGVSKPYTPSYAKHTFIKFPFLVKDQKVFLKLAKKNKIPLGDWMNSPLHPIQENLDQWNYTLGHSPISEKISQHILNLPTDLGISEKEAARIINFLKRNKDLILKNWEVS